VSGQYLSVSEVAELLAVDHKVIRRAIERGELPAIRIGRLLRVDPADLEALAYRPRPGARPARTVRPRPPRGEFAQLARAVSVEASANGGAA
jgi:excisionase family DNA binding protein